MIHHPWSKSRNY